MAHTLTRSRQTIASLFWWTLNLMTKSPPHWAFKYGTCQDNDGRFRVHTADCIWIGYLKHLASGGFVNPCEECPSVQQAVDAASLHPAEWVQAFCADPSEAAIQGCSYQARAAAQRAVGVVASASRCASRRCRAGIVPGHTRRWSASVPYLKRSVASRVGPYCSVPPY